MSGNTRLFVDFKINININKSEEYEIYGEAIINCTGVVSIKKKFKPIEDNMIIKISIYTHASEKVRYRNFSATRIHNGEV